MLMRTTFFTMAMLMTATAFAAPVNEKCPVSGEAVNAEQTSAYNGKTVAFCCGKCKSKFDENPQQFVSKIDGLEAPAADAAGDVKTATVKGKIVVPENDRGIGKSFEKGQFVMAERIVVPQPKLPDNYAKMTADEKRAWSTEYFASDEGKAWIAKRNEIMQNRKVYQFKVNDDGTFEIKDVKVADYVLQGGLPSEDGKSAVAEIAPQLVKVTEEGLDLGEVKMAIPLSVGDMAPEIEFVTIGDENKKLSDYRGQYVIIDFWATWCGPCKAETPNLKAIYAKFGSRKDFEIIGLSTDQKPELPKAYYEEKQVEWVNGFIGPGSEAAKAYGVRGIPSIWLIGPDGKIVANGGAMRMQNTMNTVETNLPKEQLN